jgi:quinol monooxygenase YgiN
MVITILTARVAPERAADLEKAYREGTAELPGDIVETFLARDSEDPNLHRILTVWSSREALDRMRAGPGKPKGVQIFEAAGAAPQLSIQEVLVRRTARDG